jgi:hypothetical protein
MKNNTRRGAASPLLYLFKTCSDVVVLLGRSVFLYYGLSSLRALRAVLGRLIEKSLASNTNTIITLYALR